ncbi:MAG TPA: cytochrome c maturation protein CcmE [Microvirga sp.]|jgi:cytochrome c-type biogenesis protein CcmE|nr:cytochrome c maturation protein CcmE [Microvirga sp.]
MTRKQRRLTLIGFAGGVLALALGLVLYAMRDTIVFFHAPADVAAKGVQPGTRFRLGGLVKEGSIKRGENQQITFVVVDAQSSLPVRYQGLLPDLFREGQGVVAEGVLEPSGTFKADTVLARHDETYMPREVADALKRQGHWQADAKPQPAATH